MQAQTEFFFLDADFGGKICLLTELCTLTILNNNLISQNIEWINIQKYNFVQRERQMIRILKAFCKVSVWAAHM